VKAVFVFEMTKIYARFLIILQICWKLYFHWEYCKNI